MSIFPTKIRYARRRASTVRADVSISASLSAPKRINATFLYDVRV